MTETETVRLLRELVDLTRVQVIPVAKEVLRQEFFSGDSIQDDRAKVYARLDGSLSQRQIAEESGVHQTTVSRWSTEWKRKGLVNGSGTAVFDLSDYFPEAMRGLNA